MNASEDQSKPEGSAPEAAADLRPAVSSSRRRLLRGGLAAAPALLALKATPVMACNCKIPSGFSASGNLSRNGGTASGCSAPGGKPSHWKTQCGSSNPYYYNKTNNTCKKGTMFKDCFSTMGSYTNYNFDTCLGRGDTDAQALVAACYMEAYQSGGTNFPTQQQILNIWKLGICGSGYQPTSQATPVWNKTQCINYLKYLTGQT